MELSTRADYTSAINRHIMWYFAPMKMRDIGPAQVREWITALKARGVSPRRIEYAKNSVLGAIFTTAVDDGVIVVHPSHRVQTDPVPQAAPDHHRAAVRRRLRGPARLRCPAFGGDGHRDWAAVGRTHRAAGQGHRRRGRTAHGCARGDRGLTQAPPSRTPVLGEELPQRQGIPPALRQRSRSMDRQCSMSITVTRTGRCLICCAGTMPAPTPLTLRN